MCAKTASCAAAVRAFAMVIHRHEASSRVSLRRNTGCAMRSGWCSNVGCGKVGAFSRFRWSREKRVHKGSRQGSWRSSIAIEKAANKYEWQLWTFFCSGTRLTAQMAPRPRELHAREDSPSGWLERLVVCSHNGVKDGAHHAYHDARHEGAAKAADDQAGIEKPCGQP